MTPSRLRAALPALALAVAGFAVYADALDGPFLFDDIGAIVDNPGVRAPGSWRGALRAPDESTLAGRPLVLATFALNHALGGLDVRGYHLTNVAIHVLCALALYGIVRRTLAGEAFAGRFLGAARPTAFAVALVWLVHPLCTEAVNYVVQRTETLMALFYLLTLYAAIRALDSRVPRRFWVVAAASCAAGMACKETMVTCPLLVPLYDAVYGGRSARSLWREHWPLYAALAAGWLLLAYLIAAGPRSDSVGFDLGVSAWDYAKNQFAVVSDYLARVVWPRSLIFDYGYPRRLAFGEVASRAALLAALGGGALALALRRPKAGFPALAFFLLLAPASSVVPIVTEVGAERRMYLPLAALVALGVVVARLGIDRLAGPRPVLSRVVRSASLAAVAGSLALATWQRNTDYADAETIWRSAIRARPDNERTYNGLGRVLYGAGRLEEAERSYRRALDLEPEFYHAQYNLGLLLADRGRSAEALEHFRRAAQLHPGRGEPHYRMASVLSAEGRDEAATVELRRALQLDPTLAEAHNDLGNALVRSGRPEEGIDHLRRALELRPDFALAHYNLALALGERGDLEAAMRHDRAAIEIDPGFAPAHNNLGTLLQRQGRSDLALESYRRALEADPSSVEVRNNAGLALAASGRVRQAREMFREALRLDPGFELARRNLDELERSMREPAPGGDQ